MRALICGSRDWLDEFSIRAVLVGLHAEPGRIVVIHGAARGADATAATVAERLGYEVEAFPADWKGHGKAAGAIRNRLMLTEGKPDVVFAFKDNFDWTLSRGGTENMVRIAKEAGIPAYVVSRA